MSLREFKELVKETWGHDKCSVSCHLKKLVPFQGQFDQLKNTFIYTGQRSVVEFRNSLGSRFAVPFDEYICVYELWMATGTNAPITIDGVKNQYNIWMQGMFDSNTGQVIPSNSPVAFPNVVWTRYYLVRFSTTKILEFD